MNLFDVILLAAALGIDCLVVSFSQGLIINKNRTKNSLALALTMGLFQGLMPIIGYIGADVISSYVENVSHWIVFVIFLLLGLKFIFEAFQQKEEKICCIGFKCLISMGFATSIDALAAGATLKFSNAGLLIPSLLIGAASFLMSFTGFWFGNSLRKFPSRILEILGGVIIIGLAFKSVM